MAWDHSFAASVVWNERRTEAKCARAALTSAANSLATSSCTIHATIGDGLISALQVLALLVPRTQVERPRPTVRPGAAYSGQRPLCGRQSSEDRTVKPAMAEARRP